VLVAGAGAAVLAAGAGGLGSGTTCRARGARLVQRRVVVQPEITGKDHDRGVHLR